MAEVGTLQWFAEQGSYIYPEFGGDPALADVAQQAIMPSEDIIPLEDYQRTMPLAQPDEPLEPIPAGLLGPVSEVFKDVWSAVTGAPTVEGWDYTSDYMAGSDDPRWQVLHDIPPIETAYKLAHPQGHEPPTGDDEMTLYGQPGYPGAPWAPYEADLETTLPATRTDPSTGAQYSPGVPRAPITILKSWWAGPRGGPRIRFIMFMLNGRKMIGCNKVDGTWKQWPAKSPSTIVIGKTLTDRKARRVATRLERYAKRSKKILGLLGYKVSRKGSK